MKDQISRRDLLKLTSGGALLGGAGCLLQEAAAQGMDTYEVQLPENTIYTSCLQCNTGCPIKVKLYEGVASKIDGNPITPWTLFPHLPLKTDVKTLAKVDGTLCPRGQAGIQSAYDPYRIRKVLKRAGPRGSGKWVEIPFEQAIQEIADGGKNFESIGDARSYPGLREYWAVRDPKVMKGMGDAIAAIWGEKDKAKKQALVEKFNTDFKEHLGAMIDPAHPDLGPKNNQVLFGWGRLKGGRSDFFKWFFDSGIGTINQHGHTTVCQGSLYFTGKAMSEQLAFDGKKYSWTGGDKFYWQADLSKAQFVIFVGANILEGNYGVPLRASRVAEHSADGKLKYVVIDPRAQKAVKNASKWIAPKPGTDAAIALGMMKLMFAEGKIEQKFLSAANKAAAKAIGEATWTNASWLVLLKDGKPDRLLRASDLKLPPLKRTHSDKEVDFDAPVVWVKGAPVVFDPNSETQGITGELFVNTRIGNLRVKSALELIKDEANKHTLEGWAQIAGVEPDDIAYLAKEFTSYGKKAVVDIHRGVSQHTNGFYNCAAWFSLNALVGNMDHQGGFVKLSTYDVAGSKAGGPFDFGKLHPAKLSPVGLSSIRHNAKYEDTTIFAGYPAKRPWYPNSSDVYQEVLPSAAQGYPYPIKIAFHYMGSPAYALPGGQGQIQALLDPDKIGLVVASDVVIGETYQYADYIVPDLSYLERWEFHGSHPSVIWKVQPIRQPAIAPLTDPVKVFGEEMPLSFEALLMGLAEYLKIPGFGEKGFANGMAFKRPEDFYLKMVANMAFGEKADGTEKVDDASDAEVAVFSQARRKLPATVFDLEKWKAAVGEAHWRRVIYLLNRGGRFQDFEKAYSSGDLVANRYGKQMNLFLDKQATTKNAMTGQPYYPLPTFIPPYRDALGNQLRDIGYGLTLITHRQVTQTKSRTAGNYWLTAIHPENHVLVAAGDATRLGLKEGQLVKVVSATNPEGVWDLGSSTKPMVGKVRVVQGMRPGTVSFTLGYGHWGYGSTDVEINGKVVKGDPRRGRGIHANAAMRLDPYLKDMALTDITGGSVVFYETKVNLLPA